MKTYVLTLSKTFLKWHPRAGEPTYFKEKFEQAQAITKAGKFPCGLPYPDFIDPKYHTIRANYPFWKKRFDEIERGEACLSIRQWSGKPYCSKMIEIARLTKEDGIGIQKLEFLEFDPAFKDGIWISGKTFSQSHKECLAENDGLSYKDWQDWFRNYDLSKPLAIIHFTKFRY